MSKGTKTSKFGAPKRESHDSTYFYESSMYGELEKVRTDASDGLVNPIPMELLNTTMLGDSQDLSRLPDLSLHLVITSPPYNSRKQYDDDLSLDEYLRLIENVFLEIYPKLVDGGRVVINLANLGRKPYIPITDYVSKIMRNIGYIHRGEIIWDKGASAGSSCAWGSWQSASNPVLRDVHEYILVFSKGTMKRRKGEKNNTISRDEFMEYTKSIWNFSTVSAKSIGHPAPFPEELPYRCIQLFSFEGDVIFDPFMGSGTTGVVALKNKRKFLGMDIKKEYVELSNERVSAYLLEEELNDPNIE